MDGAGRLYFSSLQGCRNEVTALLERYQVAVGAVGIIFAILQVQLV